MPHDTSLIATVAVGIALAFLFGFAASRLRLPAIVGYLIAGVVVGPFTPGYVADAKIASQLAEIGVILLMFGVGIHFSPRDLLAVRRIAVPGAIAQIAAATALGAGLAVWWGWGWTAGLVFGLSLSVASTVVLLRALEGLSMLDSLDGRIAVGWLIVEDLVTVLALVLLPVFAAAVGSAPGAEGGRSLLATLGLTLFKVSAFVALMHVVGRRVVPWLLVRVASGGSRELFTLAVLAVALGVAFGAAALFGVSLALGAFFAGVVVGESELSHQAASDALPLQDAFGVLFFVAVGMLFDPTVLVREPLRVAAVLAVVMVGKSLAALLIVAAFRYPLRTALTISASLAQIGEFSFIVGALAASLGLLPTEAQGLIVSGALLSITLNPLVFRTVPAASALIAARPTIGRWLERGAAAPAEVPASLEVSALGGHAIVVGHGRVGRPISEALAAAGVRYLVVEQSREEVVRLRRENLPVVLGDASRPGVLALARLDAARLLVVATPDPIQARAIVSIARATNPSLEVVVRTHSESESDHFARAGIRRIVLGEREAALAMARHALQVFGVE